MKNPSDSRQTIFSLLKKGEEILQRRKMSDNPRMESEHLLAFLTGGSRLDLYVKFDEMPAEEMVKRFFSLVEKRGRGFPLQYLLGEEIFFKRSFRVGPGVLIPRPETEMVVRQALPLLSGGPFLDLGTGSGCIAVTLLKEGPAELRGIAIDLSPAALRYAEENARLHGVEDRISLLTGDLFSPLPVRYRGFLGLIVSNPPYIDWGWDPMDYSVRQFEPKEALDGGAGGLSFYEKILREAGQWLVPGGGLVFELGKGQIGSLRKLMNKIPGWKELGVHKDEQGIDRVLTLAWNGMRGYGQNCY